MGARQSTKGQGVSSLVLSPSGHNVGVPPRHLNPIF